MRVWVDADACPKVIKEILYRAANRTKITVILVSNQTLQVPLSPFIKRMQVPAGFDMADNQIVQKMQCGDLVVTADIPLADAVVDLGGSALNPRGELYSKNNIKQRLSMRNFNESLRSCGIITRGQSRLSQREVHTFANCLDKLLTFHRYL
jgi:uncharacterized protein YaiI (UPF0178 family)